MTKQYLADGTEGHYDPNGKAVKHVTITLTEDQLRELRSLVRQARVDKAREVLSGRHFDQPNEDLAYIKRLETTLVKQLTKN